MEFIGEFYIELVDYNGEKMEHIGFRSENRKFEDMMMNLPENVKLPQKAKISIELIED